MIFHIFVDQTAAMTLAYKQQKLSLKLTSSESNKA